MALGDITERKLTENALKEQQQFQKLVTKISTKFLGLSGVEFEQSIYNALGEIGKYFDVDTVRLYRLSLQGDVVKIRNMWRSEQLAPPEEMPEIHKMKYPNLASHYSQGESVVFNKFEDSPPWPEMSKILKFFGTKAGVGVPLESDDSGVDVFALDKVQSEYVWPINIVEQSKTIGKVILSAMRRREAEVELQASYDEVKSLKDSLEQENIYLQEEIKRDQRFEEIIGHSNELRYILRRVEEISDTDTTVLILGETGTGKELIARAIHSSSQRKKRPLLVVNCAALPSNLIESELFGHEKGAFSGAISLRIGRFEMADGATLILDEIGELPLELQAKLLRVLQNGEFERLGSSKTLKADVRVIAVTNRDLADEIKNRRFRPDLFYRLNIFPITVLPLREHKDDIPPLVNHFVGKYCRKMGKEIHEISLKSMEEMQNYYWPGNIRELENIIERAVITTRGNKLKVELPVGSAANILESNKTLEELERDHIINILERSRWKIAGPGGAAEVLGIHSNTLRSRMEKLGISKS